MSERIGKYTLVQFAKKLGACESGVEWLKQFEDVDTAWFNAQDVQERDWMVWCINRLSFHDALFDGFGDGIEHAAGKHGFIVYETAMSIRYYYPFWRVKAACERVAKRFEAQEKRAAAKKRSRQ